MNLFNECNEEISPAVRVAVDVIADSVAVAAKQLKDEISFGWVVALVKLQVCEKCL